MPVEIIDDALAVDFRVEDDDLHASLQTVEIEILRHLIALAVIQRDVEILRIDLLNRCLDISAFGKGCDGSKQACRGQKRRYKKAHDRHPSGQFACDFLCGVENTRNMAEVAHNGGFARPIGECIVTIHNSD